MPRLLAIIALPGKLLAVIRLARAVSRHVAGLPACVAIPEIPPSSAPSPPSSTSAPSPSRAVGAALAIPGDMSHLVAVVAHPRVRLSGLRALAGHMALIPAVAANRRLVTFALGVPQEVAVVASLGLPRVGAVARVVTRFPAIKTLH